MSFKKALLFVCFCLGFFVISNGFAKVDSSALGGSQISGFTCPSDWPKQDNNATSIEDCYKVCTAGHTGGRGPKIHYKKVSCAPGEYLPYEKDACQKCTFAASQGIVCTGVKDVYPSCGQNQGTKKCADDEKPNADRTDCVKTGDFTCPSDFPDKDSNATSVEGCYKVCTAGHTGGRGPKIHNKKISCAPGEYLPYEKDECKKCAFAASEGKVCPGITDVYPSCSQNQGIKKCEGDEKPNAAKTDCVNQNGQSDKTESSTPEQIEVAAGKYLPANKVTPADCPGNNKYCPGGIFSKSSEDQGIYDFALSKDAMQYGPDGDSKSSLSKQCWIKRAEDEYKDCILNDLI